MRCNNCQEDVEVEDIENSNQCPNCFNEDALEELREDKESINPINTDEKIISIELTYQSNGKKIIIDCANAINILGRNGFGSDLLSEIMFNNRPVISREHCRIEYDVKKNVITVTDLGSTNGTFIEDRLCNEKTKLENQSFLVLGRERFFVNFIFETMENELKIENLYENKQNEIKYICLNCNKIYITDEYEKVDGKCCGGKLNIKRNG